MAAELTTNPVSFLTSGIYKILAIVLAVLLLVSGGFNVYYHYHVQTLNSTITDTNQQIGKLKGDVAQRDATIVSQNQQIKDAADKSKDTQKQVDDLGKQLDDQTKTNKALIEKMKSQPAPKTCDESKTYMKNNLEIFQW